MSRLDTAAIATLTAILIGYLLVESIRGNMVALFHLVLLVLGLLAVAAEAYVDTKLPSRVPALVSDTSRGSSWRRGARRYYRREGWFVAAYLSLVFVFAILVTR
jgi:phosphoglycerol transferase MdoB-like AlkP superfamily enzyme